jgi:hypothetical protein
MLAAPASVHIKEVVHQALGHGATVAVLAHNYIFKPKLMNLNEKLRDSSLGHPEKYLRNCPLGFSPLSLQRLVARSNGNLRSLTKVWSCRSLHIILHTTLQITVNLQP